MQFVSSHVLAPCWNGGSGCERVWEWKWWRGIGWVTALPPNRQTYRVGRPLHPFSHTLPLLCNDQKREQVKTHDLEQNSTELKQRSADMNQPSPTTAGGAFGYVRTVHTYNSSMKYFANLGKIHQIIQ